jgi:hypothetical protein
VLYRNRLIGVGLANLFRADLPSADVGHGWHAYRIYANADFGNLNSVPLFLIEVRERALICAVEVPVPPTGIVRQRLSTDLVLNDNSLLVTDLRGIAASSKIFDAFAATKGVERFVELAYCYVLGRPADPDGSKQYSALIASRQLTPFALIEILYKSDERAVARWPIVPPSDPGFPFRID